MKLTAKNWRDRAEAWLSCSEHLLQDWTEEKGEYEQGKIISEFCLSKYEECMNRFLEEREG